MNHPTLHYGHWQPNEDLPLKELGNRNYLRLAKDEHLVRLHIGLEDPKDLIEDLRSALKYIK